LDPKDAVFIAVEGDGLAMLLEVTFRRQSVAEKTLAFDKTQLSQLARGIVNEHQQNTWIRSSFKPVMG
jgi:hypothetical protein